jgi:hypothetical protein
VICPQIDVTGAYIDGYREGGEDEGHRAVQQLFLHAGSDCVRTLRRDQVPVMEKSMPDDGWCILSGLACPKWALSG